MQNFVVYVLFSEIHERIYVGMTQHLIQRVRFHNELSETGYTKKFRPWKVVYVEFCSTKEEAFKREKQLKTARGRRFIHEEVLPWFKSN